MQKKRLSIIFSLVLSTALFAGCGNNTAPASDNAITETTEAQETAEPEMVSEEPKEEAVACRITIKSLLCYNEKGIASQSQNKGGGP